MRAYTHTHTHSLCVSAGVLVPGDRADVDDDSSVSCVRWTHRRVSAHGSVRRLLHQHHGSHSVRAGGLLERVAGHRLPPGHDVRPHDRRASHRR